MESRNHPGHQVLSQFRTLSRSLIDASSIIYMHKTGFLTTLADTINLHSPLEIIAETDFNDLNISPITCTSDSLSSDQKLITAALELRWSVTSEDKNILMHMEKANLPYFNSLMMLNFLLFRERIDPKSYAIYLERLKRHAWYSPYVWEFGKNLYDTIADLSRHA